MNNQDARLVIIEAIKHVGKQPILDTMQWLANFGVIKSKETANVDFVEYAQEYVKSVADNKKPSGYSVKSYDDKAEMVAKYVLWFAGDDIAEKQAK